VREEKVCPGWRDEILILVSGEKSKTGSRGGDNKGERDEIIKEKEINVRQE
jgi:hypothetical protein